MTFEAILFLCSSPLRLNCNCSLTSLQNGITTVPLPVSQYMEEELEVEVEPLPHSQHYETSTVPSTSDGGSPEVLLSKSKQSRPNSKRRGTEIDSVLGVIMEHFQRQKQKKDEDCPEVFGKSVAAKMRDILDYKQRLVAEKIMNYTLFIPEMGQLKPTHTICDMSADSTLLYSKYCIAVGRSSSESLA
ncbi:uncharacterized protein LOC126328599 [Schistocerca gregaria]|uniref:uncharacterized protein LOC126328599 n=1 Tax=Schistocerca gregaria TaxID=7010 RepID=UPI00211DE7BB|nr:uncharacterized protein LOC126328599 [Schistocerca gregaria]